MFWVLAAILTAIVTAFVVTPLVVTKAEQNYRIVTIFLCFLIPFLALGISFLNGVYQLAN